MRKPQTDLDAWEKSQVVLTFSVLGAAGGMGIIAAATDSDAAGFGALLFAIGCTGVASCLPQIVIEVIRRGRQDETKD